MNKIFKKIKFPKKKTYAEMQFFFSKKEIYIDKNYKFITRENVVKENKVYGPEIEDLYRLYHFDKEYDQHIFYLDDPTLGLINKKLLEFYKIK